MPGSSSDLSNELQAIFNENGVPTRFIDFLKKHNVTSVHQFASAASTEEKVETSVIAASGLKDLEFGETVAITSAWNACRSQMGNGASSSASGTPKQASGMPEGVEIMLRAKWRGLHGFPLMGSWMVNEDTMTKIYSGLNAGEKSLHVPDIASMARRSDLSQKPNKGTLITESSVEHVEYSLDPCTTHPEFHLRMRAYLMTIAYLSITNPDWFTLETALITTDFLFEQVNMRPDGKRPTLACLSACYLAMFGEFAKVLQNEGTSLEEWIKNKTNWQHLWKESITSYDNESKTGDMGGFAVPTDLVAMTKMNSSLIKGLQGNFDKKLSQLSAIASTAFTADNNQGGGGRDTRDKRRGFGRAKKGKGRQDNTANGNGNGNRGGGKGGKQGRKVTTEAEGQGAWRKRKHGRQ